MRLFSNNLNIAENRMAGRQCLRREEPWLVGASHGSQSPSVSECACERVNEKHPYIYITCHLADAFIQSGLQLI